MEILLEMQLLCNYRKLNIRHIVAINRLCIDNILPVIFIKLLVLVGLIEVGFKDDEIRNVRLNYSHNVVVLATDALLEVVIHSFLQFFVEVVTLAIYWE
jgi:hypothetical protein